jgi:hypothetical protein
MDEMLPAAAAACDWRLGGRFPKGGDGVTKAQQHAAANIRGEPRSSFCRR